MVSYLITWVLVGSMHTMAVEPVSPQLCPAMRAEAVTSDTVRAAACVTTGEQIAEALRVGGCRAMEGGTPELQIYVCNGSLPKWK